MTIRPPGKRFGSLELLCEGDFAPMSWLFSLFSRLEGSRSADSITKLGLLKAPSPKERPRREDRRPDITRATSEVHPPWSFGPKTSFFLGGLGIFEAKAAKAPQEDAPSGSSQQL